MIIYQKPEHKHIYRWVGKVYEPIPQQWWRRLIHKPKELGRLLQCNCGTLFYADKSGITCEEVIDIGLNVFGIKEEIKPEVF